MSWIRFGVILLLLTLTGGPTPASDQETDEPPTPEEALTSMEEGIRELRDQLAEDPGNEQLWMNLLQAEGMRLMMRHQTPGGAMDAEAMQRESQALSESILAEWEKAQPDDPAPHLFRLRIARDPETRREDLQELIRRFPDDAKPVVEYAQLLEREGETARASGLIEGFLAKHPGNGEAYSFAIGFYQRRGHQTRRWELLERWPREDSENPRSWLALLEGLNETPSERERTEIVVAEAVSRFAVDDSAVRLCERIGTILKEKTTEPALECYGRLLASEDEAIQEKAAGGLAAFLGTLGEVGNVRQVLAQLPEEQRPGAQLLAATRLAESGDCAGALDLVEPLLEHRAAQSEFTFQLGQAVAACLRTPRGVAMARRLVATFENTQLPELTQLWAGKVSSAELESWIRSRLDPSSKSNGYTWIALVALYQSGRNLDEERALALLEEWAREDLESMGTSRLATLGEKLLARGRVDAAVSVLERGLERWPEGGNLLLEPLVDAYLSRDDTDLARAAGTRYLASDPHDPGPGHRALARIALAEGRWEEAERQYELYLDTTQVLLADRVREFWAMVAYQDRVDELPDLLGAFYDRSAARGNTPHGGRDRFIAEELDELGLYESSFRYWRQALEKSPGDAKIYRGLWDQAMAQELWPDAEWAARRLLDLNPRDSGAWARRGEIASAQDDLAALTRLAEEARELLGKPVSRLEALVTEALMDKGEFRLAAERVMAAYRSAPYAEALRSLRKTALARIAPDPAPWRALEPSDTPASEPADRSPDELLEEAEAWHSGTAGRVDPARAQGLFREAAERGSSLAKLRIAVLTHLGASGWRRDRELAAEMAAESLPRVEARTEAGDAYATYLLGTAAQLGLGRSVDLKEAKRLYQASATEGVTFAMHNLGAMYFEGIGSPPDRDMARDWFRRAAEAGNVISMYGLAALDWDSHIPALRAEAEHWLRQAAEHGHVDAMARVGGELYDGRWEGRDDEAAIVWLRKAAAHQQPWALHSLGHAHLFGRGVDRDLERARRFFGLALEGGDTRARMFLDWLDELPSEALLQATDGVDVVVQAVLLGHESRIQDLLYWYGSGAVDRERIRTAFASLRAQAGGDNLAAQAAVASALIQGIFGEEDLVEGTAWARSAAERGSGHAMRVLGWAYRNGKRVPKDEDLGLEWLLRAGEAGDSIAMLWAGRALLYEINAPKDEERALALLERSAELGNFHAMKDVAVLYETGFQGVVPVDLEKARHYYERLAERGDLEARGWLELNQ